MNKQDLNKWIMYHQIHYMRREGCSILKIAKELVIDPRTIKKYLKMNEEDYENFLLQQKGRYKVLSPYEWFIKEKLGQFPETGAAQMHDWLKEHYPDFPKVNQKTVYNFVMWVRQKYNIPKETHTREYFIVEELPYGQQAQVDFGEYNMRLNNGKRKKVYFFCMVLSRSRKKYVLFSERPFTTLSTINAHEKAFEYFQGIPKELVYDQDKLLLVNENAGELVLTKEFKRYNNTRNFNLHFCRKADPESKGKIENVVKYVKQNFLYNRLYVDIDGLNAEAMGWLTRTANALPHNRTKKIPYSEWLIEKKRLSPYCPIKPENSKQPYNVRKDNTITYKSNFYTLPLGTYQNTSTKVFLLEEDGHINIFDKQDKLICRYKIASGKGKIISNTDHKRDKSKAIGHMINELIGLFDDKEMAIKYINTIKEEKPRYIRDQLLIIKKAIDNTPKQIINQALSYCMEHNIYSAVDFKSVIDRFYEHSKTASDKIPEIKLLDKANIDKASTSPSSSDIIDYENIFKNKN